MTTSNNKMFSIGSPTGFCDSSGQEIKIGDFIRVRSDYNEELHGKFVFYSVELQGIIPVLRYFISKTGQKLPVGYTGCCLSDKYDLKMLLFATNTLDLRPEEPLTIVTNKQYPFVPKKQDVVVIDVESLAWASLVQAANDSIWIPTEYTMNDWVADACLFLRVGPGIFNHRKV